MGEAFPGADLSLPEMPVALLLDRGDGKFVEACEPNIAIADIIEERLRLLQNRSTSVRTLMLLLRQDSR